MTDDLHLGGIKIGFDPDRARIWDNHIPQTRWAISGVSGKVPERRIGDPDPSGGLGSDHARVYSGAAEKGSEMVSE